MVAVAICTTTTFSACSDDDKVETNDLIGTWELTQSKGWQKRNGVVENEWNKTIDYFSSWEFKGDGKCIFMEDWENVIFTYRVNESQLILTGRDEVLTIKTLTKNSLELEETGIYTYNGDVTEYYELNSYKRIE